MSENITEIQKDVIYMYHELMMQRKNFSGHYEGNEFQAINVFGSGVEVGAVIVDGMFSDFYPDDKDEMLKHGAAIGLLCKVSETVDAAFDRDENVVDIVRQEHCDVLNAMNNGFRVGEPLVDKALFEAFVDPKSFNRCLVDVFNKIVFKYFVDMIDDVKELEIKGS